jgi:hypothetical protein
MKFKRKKKSFLEIFFERRAQKVWTFDGTPLGAMSKGGWDSPPPSLFSAQHGRWEKLNWASAFYTFQVFWDGRGGKQMGSETHKDVISLLATTQQQ